MGLRVIGDTVDTGVNGPAAGYTLVNGTGNVLATMSVPGDSVHAVLITLTLVVTGVETGGQLVTHYALGGIPRSLAIDSGGTGTGQFARFMSVVCDPGSAIWVSQDTALTAGAAVAYISMARLT